MTFKCKILTMPLYPWSQWSNLKIQILQIKVVGNKWDINSVLFTCSNHKPKNNSTCLLNKRFIIFCKAKSENFLRYHSIASRLLNLYQTITCFGFRSCSTLEDVIFFRISTSSRPNLSRVEIIGPTFRFPSWLSVIITW